MTLFDTSPMTMASFSTVTCQWTLTSLGSSARVSEFWDKYAASAARFHAKQYWR